MFLKNKGIKILLYLLAAFLLFILTVVFLIFSSNDRQLIFGAQKEFEHNNISRSYKISMPDKITDQTKIIFGLHGFSDNNMRFAYYSALHNIEPDNIYVYPNATQPRQENIKAGWNAEFCCGSGFVNKVDDSGFLKDLALKLISENSINPSNVFITGFSNGAMMAMKAANDNPDVFKAVASVAGTVGTNDKSINVNNPMPVLLIHGREDTTVDFEGAGDDPEFQWLSFDNTLQDWSQINSCGDKTISESLKKDIIKFKDCNNPTEAHIYNRLGHRWPDWRLFNFWNSKPEGSRVIIDFFNSNIQ